MSKIKSKLANDVIEGIKEDYQYLNKELFDKIANEYREVCEMIQDHTEDRAVKAFCTACTYYIDYSHCERVLCSELRVFKQVMDIKE